MQHGVITPLPYCRILIVPVMNVQHPNWPWKSTNYPYIEHGRITSTPHAAWYDKATIARTHPISKAFDVIKMVNDMVFPHPMLSGTALARSMAPGMIICPVPHEVESLVNPAC